MGWRLRRQLILAVLKLPEALATPQAGIISVLSTKNNTIITLADLEGQTRAWASAGTLGFTNSRKKTTHAAEAVATHLAERVRMHFHACISWPCRAPPGAPAHLLLPLGACVPLVCCSGGTMHCERCMRWERGHACG